MVFTSNALLVIGRGELYFNRFAPGSKSGDGEAYIGNTPGFTIQRATQDLDRFRAYGGKQVKRDTIVTRDTMTGSMVTDNMSLDNLALFYGSNVDTTGQLAVGDITETFSVKKGRFYQLGISQEPFGARWIEPDYAFSKVLVSGNIPLTVSTNLIVDRTEGRFQVLNDAADLNDGDQVSVTFQYRSSKSVTLKKPGQDTYGSLRFIAKADNAPSYFFPYVRLTPSGALDLKSDNWQQATFAIEILRLSPAVDHFYALLPALAQYTEDEQAIIDLSGVTLDEFPYWEDQLNTIINITMPNDDLGHIPVYP